MLAFMHWSYTLFWSWVWNTMWNFKKLKHFHLFVVISCFNRNVICHSKSVISNQKHPDQMIIWFQIICNQKERRRENLPVLSTSLFPVASCWSTPLAQDKMCDRWRIISHLVFLVGYEFSPKASEIGRGSKHVV